MDDEILTLIATEGGKFIAEWIRINPPKRKPIQYPEEITDLAEPREISTVPPTSEEKVKKGTACLPCTNSHLHTCVGLLNEAVRMSHNGITPEGIERIDGCLAEIAAAERVDLAPENIVNLPAEEKRIADYTAKEIRDIRHDIEGLSSPEQLQQIAAKTAQLQHYVGQEWFKERLSKMTPEARQELQKKIELKLKEQEVK